MRSFFWIIEGALCCLAAVMRTAVVVATAGEMPAGCGKDEAIRLVPCSVRVGEDARVLKRVAGPVFAPGARLLDFYPPAADDLGFEGLAHDHEWNALTAPMYVQIFVSNLELVPTPNLVRTEAGTRGVAAQTLLFRNERHINSERLGDLDKVPGTRSLTEGVLNAAPCLGDVDSR